jgi:hypothetical protein
MKPALSQTETLAIIMDCSALAGTASWEDTLQKFAETLSAVSDKLTVVEFAHLAMIEAGNLIA